MVVRAIELGCERGWRRAHWRDELAIPNTAPCLGILWSPDSLPFSQDTSHPKNIESIVRPMAQELRWAVPGIRIGILDGPNASSGDLHAQSHLRSSEPFQIRASANHPMRVLDWICGVDVWLSLSDSPLATAIERIASDLRLPLLAPQMREPATIESAPSLWQDGWSRIAHAIARQIQSADAQLAMLAFRSGVQATRTGASAMTVEEALRLLDDSIHPSHIQPTSKTESQQIPVEFRPAA